MIDILLKKKKKIKEPQDWNKHNSMKDNISQLLTPPTSVPVEV